MAVHFIRSPKHGELRIVTSGEPCAKPPSWRAVLDPRPPRLAHLLAFHASTEAEAVGGLLAAADKYDAVAGIPRQGDRWD